MENPDPVREHRELEKLTGHYSGPERMHPSYFNESERKARATTDARLALDGFAVVQDYIQELDDGTRFAGHGVFRYDMPSDTYELHWFDSTGGPERIFRGGFADNMLVLTARVGEGWQRLTYDFNLDGGYRLKIETSEDGERWNVAIEGDNFVEQMAERRTPSVTAGDGARTARRTSRKKSAGKMTAKKASPKSTSKKKVASKATARKPAVKKAAGKKAVAKKATGKKTGARKASAAATRTKKAAAKKATGKKGVAKKTAGKKATANKAGAKKAGAKKAGAKKAGAKKAGAKKATAKSASRSKAAAPRKTAAKKAAKTTSKRKVAARTQVSELERDRRQGKASKKIGAGKKRTSTAATRTAVSQKKTKSAAQEGPRMPGLEKTSTRVSWHKTAAKGKNAN